MVHFQYKLAIDYRSDCSKPLSFRFPRLFLEKNDKSWSLPSLELGKIVHHQYEISHWIYELLWKFRIQTRKVFGEHQVLETLKMWLFLKKQLNRERKAMVSGNNSAPILSLPCLYLSLVLGLWLGSAVRYSLQETADSRA